MTQEVFHQKLHNIEVNLMTTHRTHRAALALCHDQFNEISFTSPEFFSKIKNVTMDLNNIKNTATLYAEQTHDKLMATWFPTLVKFFANDDVERLSHKKLDMLYRSVNVLLSNQIKYFLKDLVKDWCHLFDESPDNNVILSKHPKIRVQLAYEENQLEFYPSLDDITQTCQEVTEILSSSLRNLPMIQSWLGGGSDAMNWLRVTSRDLKYKLVVLFFKD